MKINLEKLNNGIHSYIRLNIEELEDKEDLRIVSDIQEVVNKYNREQIERA